MKKEILISLSIMATFGLINCGGGSSDEAKNLLKYMLKVVGIPPPTSITICQVDKTNHLCGINDKKAVINIGIDEDISSVFEKIKKVKDFEYLLETDDPSKKILMEMKDDDVKYDDNKFTFEFEGLKKDDKEKELSALQTMIDSELLKEKNVLAVRKLILKKDQEQFYKMLLDNIKQNQNTLRKVQEEPNISPDSSIYSEGSNNPGFYQAMRDNIIEVSKNLLKGGIEVEFPAKVNACNGDESCVKGHMDELSTLLVITEKRAKEIYSGRSTANGGQGNSEPTATTTPKSTPMKTVWKTDNGGTSDNNQVTIPTDVGTSNNNKITYLAKDADTGYNYSVDWGDGKIENNLTRDATHTYASAGTYTVSIYGKFPHIEFGKNSDGDANTIESDARKLLSIEQWGDIKWTSMENAFNECTNLVINAQDKPNLSSVTTTKAMFSEAESFNQDISGWDVSHITNMDSMFASASKFNQDISSWNVSNVTNMVSMFINAQTFNQDISSWDVSSVTNMNGMFESAKHFNQNLGNWKIGNVGEMKSMLVGTSLSSENYGYILEGWSEQRVKPSIQLGVGDINYNCESLINRDKLTSLWGWIIFDGEYHDENYYTEDDCRDAHNPQPEPTQTPTPTPTPE